MTKEEKQTMMQSLEKALVEQAKKYNKASLDGMSSDATKIDSDMKENIKEYTSFAQGVCFAECIEAADPMVEACNRLSFSVLAIKDSKLDDKTTPHREIVRKDKYIDLLKLHRFADGIGHDTKWNQYLEEFNLRMTLRVAVDMGYDAKDVKAINDSYYMTHIAREQFEGEEPVTNTKIMTAMEELVTAMIGDGYKPIARDRKYVDHVYSSMGKKALHVSCANHSQMRRIMMMVCHRLLNNGIYTVDYDIVDGKKA